MVEDDKISVRDTGGPEEKDVSVGLEGGEERPSPRKNLIAAAFIAALSLLAMFLATRLQVPDRILTAPGLLPFLTGLSLLGMAFALGFKAVREGGAKNLFQWPGDGVRAYFEKEETQRTLLLIGIIFLYVILVGHITFDLRLPTSILVFRFSSYEAISIPILTWILRIFWRGSLARCFTVSLIVVISLASIFRDGFKILLPESG